MNADEIKVREIQVKSILSTSNLPVADYSVNPYLGCPHACKYCYASFMKRFTGHPEPWGTFLDVKYWPEIRNPGKYAGKQLFIGSVTDPYGPQEKIYKRTRALLEQLQDSGAEISSYKIRFGAAGPGFDKNISPCPRFLVRQHA